MPCRPSNIAVTIMAESVGPAKPPRIWNGSTGSVSLRMSGKTAIHENRKAMAKNATRGYLEKALFILYSFSILIHIFFEITNNKTDINEYYTSIIVFINYYLILFDMMSFHQCN
jgi:hypothetical protein